MEDLIRNVYCIGRNYALHAAEMGNAVPEQPMMFGKPSHAVVPLDGGTITLPGGQGDIHYETELVLHISRSYERGMFVDEIVDRMALGLDLTLRDVQSELKKKGYPWLAAKGFIGSAPLTRMIAFPGTSKVKERDFVLMKSGVEMQRGNVGGMVFDMQTIVDYCGERFGLGRGDVIFTGTPAGVGPIRDGDLLQLLWGGELLGEAVFRFA